MDIAELCVVLGVDVGTTELVEVAVCEVDNVELLVVIFWATKTPAGTTSFDEEPWAF